jgi:hypothetical protein
MNPYIREPIIPLASIMTPSWGMPYLPGTALNFALKGFSEIRIALVQHLLVTLAEIGCVPIGPDSERVG